MSYKLYDDADIQDIADAIREKNGSQDTYKVRQMGDAIRTISSGLSEDIKQALLDCFAHVAWIDDQGQTYYDALYDALYPPANLTSITCVYTQGGTVYDTDTLESLKTDLVVTAHYSDLTTETVTTYTLSGSLSSGTSTITVLYGGKSTTFDVVVSVVEYPMLSYEIGGISSTDGTDSVATNRIRTDYIPTTSGVTAILMMSGLQFLVRKYDSNKAFTGNVSTWADNYKADFDGYVRLVIKKADGTDFAEGELDGYIISTDWKWYSLGVQPNVQTIDVYNGKGVSGTSVMVDNANRALTDEFTASSYATFVWHTTDDISTTSELAIKAIDSSGNVITDFALRSSDYSYITTTSKGDFGPKENRVIKISFQYTGSTPIAKWRLLFANGSNTSTPLDRTPDGIVIMGNTVIKLQEGQA